MLPGCDHAGLQAAFSNAQVALQAIHQIHQQALVLQLAGTRSALQYVETILVT